MEKNRKNKNINFQKTKTKTKTCFFLLKGLSTTTRLQRLRSEMRSKKFNLPDIKHTCVGKRPKSRYLGTCKNMIPMEQEANFF